MKKHLFSLLFIALNAALFAQTVITVQGKVTDAKNEALVGVNIVLKGTTIGTLTDISQMKIHGSLAHIELIRHFFAGLSLDDER